MTKKYNYRQAAKYLNSSGDLPDVYTKKNLKKLAKDCRLIPLYGNKYAKWQLDTFINELRPRQKGSFIMTNSKVTVILTKYGDLKSDLKALIKPVNESFQYYDAKGHVVLAIQMPANNHVKTVQVDKPDVTRYVGGTFYKGYCYCIFKGLGNNPEVSVQVTKNASK